ncbi:UNVERIFIED_CONTAM: hypothetical protein FKN15_029637 [Acipenser sinensis]
MGNSDSKLNFRKAVIQLTTKTQAVEKLVQAAESGCPSQKEKQIVLNCTRLLTRILPYIFEDADWRGFFWSTVPGAGRAGADDGDDDSGRPLAESLLLAIADLLFCPEFTVQSHKKGSLADDGDNDSGRSLAESLLLAIADLLFCPEFTVQSHKKGSLDSAEDIHSIDSCEYIWEAGVGFAHSPPLNYIHDLNRTELLKLLLTCFSEAMYLAPSSESNVLNPWVQFFCSTDNRHALPLFTSLLNVVCAYDPVGYGIPYNHLLFSDYREQLVEHAGQVLIVMLEHEGGTAAGSPTLDGTTTTTAMDDQDPVGPDNLFVNYLSRIHREEDFQFILKGVARLLTNPLVQTYLPNSTKKIQFHQELLVLFWKLCDFNKKFLFFVLKSSDVLDILVPILFYLNDARADQSRVGLMHIGVFILLLLSGERNFGVRLNKPYSVRVPMDIPVFTGTHADLLIVIFHKIITSGHQRLQPLFDCLLTIVVNVSPYLKSLSMVAANKLLHLLEAFSTSWFLFSDSQNHHLVFFLLEVFNNIIQYQFDGIDKLTEKSQVSEDGTMISVQPTDSNQSPSDISGAAGASDTESNAGVVDDEVFYVKPERRRLSSTSSVSQWTPTSDWVLSWKCKLPLQTIMRLLQVLVPQVEKICIDKGLTDESEILKFLQHGTLVGLLPVPHPILIRKYQANSGTAMWFRTYMWGVIYLRNVDPPIWYDTDVKLFEIQRV